MDLVSERRRNILHEQLVSLWAFYRNTRDGQLIMKCLHDGPKENINIDTCNQILYFLLGIINKDERDRLIKWPVINIQSQTKFRKGITTMLKDLIEKYPHMNLHCLPESYLMDPAQNQSKIIKFMIRLANFVIFITLNDPETLVMNSRQDLNIQEVELGKKILQKARSSEENFILTNKFPISDFEKARGHVIQECVKLKKENITLQSAVHQLRSQLIEKGILKQNSSDYLHDMEQVRAKTMNELKLILEELDKYNSLSQKVLKIIETADETVHLKAEDIGMENELDFAVVIKQAFDNLEILFRKIKQMEMDINEKQKIYDSMKQIKDALLNEQNALNAFISMYSEKINDIQ